MTLDAAATTWFVLDASVRALAAAVAVAVVLRIFRDAFAQAAGRQKIAAGVACVLAITLAIACRQEIAAPPLREDPALAKAMAEEAERGKRFEAARDMTQEQADALEQRLALNPQDFDAREPTAEQLILRGMKIDPDSAALEARMPPRSGGYEWPTQLASLYAAALRGSESVWGTHNDIRTHVEQMNSSFALKVKQTLEVTTDAKLLASVGISLIQARPSTKDAAVQQILAETRALGRALRGASAGTRSEPHDRKNHTRQDEALPAGQ